MLIISFLLAGGAVAEITSMLDVSCDAILLLWTRIVLSTSAVATTGCTTGNACIFPACTFRKLPDRKTLSIISMHRTYPGALTWVLARCVAALRYQDSLLVL